MEQAVNQFNKGLQTDTHPMVLGNDTLSDALNATFVTMNGNEVVLQNDMGNRRIDNAFLPTGYLPLGMKEYGGVIYVAAYNPLTNRGLVGSFPSPLRKVNIDNKDGANLIFENFLGDTGSYKIIDKEYIIIPISDGIVLHTGDKFSIYSELIGEILPYLTLPGATKNNLFTFQVGVFNSLNEFVDISDKLKIWDNGYFIAPEKAPELSETIADSELLKARNRLAINTYSQKMASPLYIKATINHINNISYFITGEVTGTNSIQLDVEVTYYYNCVDDINGKTFEIYFKGPNDNGGIYSKSKLIGDITYSQETEQYSVTYLYTITDNNVPFVLMSGAQKYHYYIKFPWLNNYQYWLAYEIYIESLNKEGDLDLSKLNSDTLVFKGYRYYNNTSTEYTTLIVNLESYPKKESSLYFYADIIDPKSNEVVYSRVVNELKPGTGTITTLFSYENLTKRKLYLFKFYYANSSGIYPIPGGFYITTAIFNGNYIGEKGYNKEDISTDIIKTTGEINYSYDVLSNIYIDDFSVIKKILLSPNLEYKVSSVPVKNSSETSGSYLKPLATTDTSSSYTLTENTQIKNTIVISASVNNIELYPSEVESLITISDSSSSNSEEIKRNIDKDEITKNGSGKYTYSKNLIENKNQDYPINEDIITISESVSSLNIENNLLKVEITSDITVNNIIKGLLEEKAVHCDHLISSFGDLIKRYYYGRNLMEYITLRAPYIISDYEGNEGFFSITTWIDPSTVDDPQYDVKLEGRRGGITNPNKDTFVDEVIRDNISNYILSECNGNLIVGEISMDDFAGGFAPCVNICYNTESNTESKEGFYYARSLKRLWMKINKKEYIPIYMVLDRDNLNKYNYSNTLRSEFFKDHLAYNTIFSQIPHYYEYETGGKTTQEKIINPNTLNRTTEFEVNSNLKVTLYRKILLNNSSNYYTLPKNYTAFEEISFTEGKITSNEGFIEDIENLSDYHIGSAILYGEIDNPEHILYIRDCEGNAIDPLYVYYDDSELKIDYGDKSKFKKSYIADKFYVEELDLYMPELKSSRKLYGGEFGEHELINEYAYPITKSRRKLINTEDNTNNILIPVDLEKVEEGDIELYGAIMSSAGGVGFDLKKPWDKTFILWEGGGEGKYGWNVQIPMRTRNIFNRTTIIDYQLVTEDENGESLMSEWKDYDTYIRDDNNESNNV